MTAARDPVELVDEVARREGEEVEVVDVPELVPGPVGGLDLVEAAAAEEDAHELVVVDVQGGLGLAVTEDALDPVADDLECGYPFGDEALVEGGQG